MKNFETMLMPFGARVAGIRLPANIDVNENTVIELLDSQKQLQTNVLYLGTAKSAAGIMEGSVSIEPASFLIIASAAPVIDQLKGIDRAGVAEVHTNLASLFNQVSTYMRNSIQQKHAAENDDRVFPVVWRDIMEQRLTSSEAIRGALMNLFPDLQLFKIILSIHFDQAASEEEYDALAEELHAVLPGVHTGRYNDAIVAITSRADRVQGMPMTQEQKQQLEELMERRHASMAVSNAVRQFDKLRTIFMLCERVVVLARSLKLMDIGRVNSYDRFSMYCVIDLAAQQYVRTYEHSDLIYLIHPCIIAITRYDAAHQSNLRDTLYYYLLSDKNLSRTTALTYMHRSTVINRINKIVEITGIDLDDGGLCQRLMFSCQLIQYFERVLNLPIKIDPPGQITPAGRKGEQA